MPALCSHKPHPFWQALAAFPAIGCAAPLLSHWFIYNALHKPMAMQLHCVIKKSLQYHRKMSFPLHLNRRSMKCGIDRELCFLCKAHLFLFFENCI